MKKGDVVIIPAEQVPNDDTKNRRFLILWQAETNTFSACPITTKGHRPDCVRLECQDFCQPGTITREPSFARPGLTGPFKQENDWVKTGTIRTDKMKEVMAKLREIQDREATTPPQPKALERPVRKAKIR